MISRTIKVGIVGEKLFTPTLFFILSLILGCAVIRMMNHFLGETTFRLGLTNYLGQL